jgi:hypothetical protein
MLRNPLRVVLPMDVLFFTPLTETVLGVYIEKGFTDCRWYDISFYS